MPKVSSKRQITLPVDQCRIAGIEAGDEFESYVDNQGHITIVKKSSGAALGMLAGIDVDRQVSEAASRQSSIGE
jgi:bifunctional DNA-binding transcriptional regulator/antitoxin component of YhaV-PrlF toxin-antitoxin module